MALIRFNYADVKTIPVNSKKELKAFINEMFFEEKVVLDSLNYVFCSDEYLLELNKSYLNHDYFTDIITFDLSKDEGVIGEIYISVDRVKENAISHSDDFRSEMLRVIFHGALHLIGYKDKMKSEITLMREKEDYYLRLFANKN